MSVTLIVSRGSSLHVDVPFLSVPPALRECDSSAKPLTLDELQRRHILATLEQTHWRVSGAKGAAALLGVKPTTLESRMAKLGIRRQA